jgi:CRP-like cAMP-binding protein
MGLKGSPRGLGVQELESDVSAWPTLYLLLDRDLIVVAASEAYLEASGLTYGAVLGRSVLDLFPNAPGGEDPSTSQSFDRVLHSRRPDTMPVRRLVAASRPGSHRVAEKYWRRTNSPLLDQAGEVKWIISSIEDVSDMMRLQGARSRQFALSPGRRAILNELRAANGILSSMPQWLFDLMVDDLAPVPMAQGATLIEPFEPVTTIYFPLRGLYTSLHHLEDGSSAEVVMGDRRGMIGLSVLGDEIVERWEVRVLVAGTALSLSAEALRAIMRAHPMVQAYIARWIPLLVAQMALSAACNARHSVQQRVALWLLKASDRLDGLELDMIQESIAMLLGSRRTGISETLSRFSAAGLVETARHRITITDKLRLRSYACECYAQSDAGERAPALTARIPDLLEAYNATASGFQA